LMERSATTGFLAANELLHTYGLAGHDLWTGPISSRHRLSTTLHRLSLVRGAPTLLAVAVPLRDAGSAYH
jgi:hypothetical protein